MLGIPLRNPPAHTKGEQTNKQTYILSGNGKQNKNNNKKQKHKHKRNGQKPETEKQKAEEKKRKQKTGKTESRKTERKQGSLFASQSESPHVKWAENQAQPAS